MIELNNNPTQADVTAYVALGNDFVAHRYAIIGTSFVEYVLLVETKEMRGYSSFYSCREPHGDYSGFTGWLGVFTSAQLPPELEALEPGSEKRLLLVSAFFELLKLREWQFIEQAFPLDFAVSIPNGLSTSVRHTQEILL